MPFKTHGTMRGESRVLSVNTCPLFPGPIEPVWIGLWVRPPSPSPEDHSQADNSQGGYRKRKVGEEETFRFSSTGKKRT